MNDSIVIRESIPGDLAAIESLYPEVFPDENLLPLIRSLLRETPAPLSLVGLIDLELVAHVMFTHCSVEGSSSKVALLGPLAVAPRTQRQGIGTALVRAGLRQLGDAGLSQVYVLGDPAYYGRFGFTPESRVMPPYALPPEWNGAWQSKTLRDTEAHPEGKLSLPGPWLQPALWAP